MNPRWCFLIFRIFFAFIFEFSNSARVRTGRKEINFALYFSAYPGPYGLEMNPGWCFLIFRIFFAFIFEFSNSARVRTGRKEIIFVINFSVCPEPFRLEMKPGWCFLIFKIFLHLFSNFLTRAGFERVGRKLFLFSIFRPILARMVMKWTLDDIFYFLEFFCIYFRIF